MINASLGPRAAQGRLFGAEEDKWETGQTKV